MPPSTSPPVERGHRTRANRLMGRVWLVVLFFFLLGMNFAGSMIGPLVGTFGPYCNAALLVSSIWSGLLIGAIWSKQAWARYVLAVFLLSSVVAQCLCLAEGLVRYPLLKGDATQVLTLVSAADIFVAIFVLISLDIRQLSHHVID